MNDNGGTKIGRGEAVDKYSAIQMELLRQRRELIQAGMIGMTGSPAERLSDLNDLASAEADQHLDLMLKERDQKGLREIQAALIRLKENRYGVCEECEAEIPYKRLLARPTSRLCVPCQTQREREEKLREALAE